MSGRSSSCHSSSMAVEIGQIVRVAVVAVQVAVEVSVVAIAVRQSGHGQ